MAEKVEVSRSQMIRDYLKSVRPSERSPTAVREALKAKGINVSHQLVSQVKSSLKNKRKKASKKSSAKVGASKGNKAVWETWILARNLLKSVDGDLVEAKKNLEIISKLLS